MPGNSRSVGSSFGSSRRAPRAPRPAFVFVRPTAEAERAFTVAAEALAPALERYVARFVRGDAHLARDLVQDTLLSAWKHLPDLREPNLLQAWLYRVAFRNAMSVLRRRGPRRRPIRSLDAGSGVEPASRAAGRGPALAGRRRLVGLRRTRPAPARGSRRTAAEVRATGAPPLPRADGPSAHGANARDPDPDAQDAASPGARVAAASPRWWRGDVVAARAAPAAPHRTHAQGRSVRLRFGSSAAEAGDRAGGAS